MPLFLSCENDFFPPSAGHSEGSGKEGGGLGGNFCHNFLPWLGLVSQARSTPAKKKKGRIWWTVYTSHVLLHYPVQSNHGAVFCHMMHYITVWVAIMHLSLLCSTSPRWGRGAVIWVILPAGCFGGRGWGSLHTYMHNADLTSCSRCLTTWKTPNRLLRPLVVYLGPISSLVSRPRFHARWRKVWDCRYETVGMRL